MIRPGIKRLFHLGIHRRDLVERDLEDEIALHLELRTRQLVEQGMSRADAEREARRRFGAPLAARRRLRSTAHHREQTVRLREWLDGWTQDLRYAVRGLRRERAFTVFVVVTLALGIGANAAMFGVVDRLMLRGPDHVRDASRVVRVYRTEHVPGYGTFTSPTTSYVMYAHLKRAAHDFSGVAAEAAGHAATLGRGAAAEPISLGSVSWDLFPMLGVSAYRGRFFSSAEDSVIGAQRVAVLGYGFWQRAFGGSDSAIGRQIVVNDASYTVIGVAPPGFTGTGLGRVDVWAPLSLIHPTPDWPRTWNAQWLDVYARLKPGVTMEEASRDATTAHHATYVGPDTALAQARLFVAPLSADNRGQTSTDDLVWQWLFGVAAAVLLIACANVINLQLARAVRRRREVAVRVAMGVGRGRLVRLLLTEGMLLTFAGAGAGLAVAFVLARVVRDLLLTNVEWSANPLDARVLAVTAVVAVGCGLAVGLVPAVRALRVDLTSDLKAGAREGGGRRSRLRTTLMVAQAALATMLVVGAGLFVRSVQRARNVDLGFDPGHVLIAGVALKGAYSYPQVAVGASPRGESRDLSGGRRAAARVAGGARCQCRHRPPLRIVVRGAAWSPGAGHDPAAAGDRSLSLAGRRRRSLLLDDGHDHRRRASDRGARSGRDRARRRGEPDDGEDALARTFAAWRVHHRGLPHAAAVHARDRGRP